MIPLKDDNPTRTTPIVTWGLVAINIAVYFYEVTLPQDGLRELVFRMGLIPAAVTGAADIAGPGFPLPLTPFTSMFLHGGFLHLAGNMLYLWIFGNNVEDETGHFRFLLFYLLCGLVAAGTQVAWSPRSEVPMIGASGAIAGVLGAYMLLFPRARVLTLVPIFIFIQLIYLPALLVLGLWFLYQILLSRLVDQVQGGVAFYAHIGGFLGGMVLVWVFRRRRPRPRPRLYLD